MRPCFKCGEPTSGRTYCRKCANALERNTRRRRKLGITRDWHPAGALDCSKPPPPPPGFREADLTNGRPLA